MNEFDNKGGSMNGPGVEQLQGELATLRILVAVILLMLIGSSVCADYFLSKQIAMQRSGVEQLQRVVAAFPQAAAQDFVMRLKEYAKTHPDFAAVVAKHQAFFGPQSVAQPLPKK